jgi:hypothetical protein
MALPTALAPVPRFHHVPNEKPFTGYEMFTVIGVLNAGAAIGVTVMVGSAVPVQVAVRVPLLTVITALRA